MTSRLLIGSAMVAALASGAARADPRIQTQFYQPAGVVTLHGRAGIETTIAFDDDEHVENVAVGNSALWQVTPNKRANLLFVKPTSARAHTNMTVITDRHTYLFDLVAEAGGAPLYMLKFSYPERPKGAVVAALRPETAAIAPATLSATPTEVAESAPVPSPAAPNPAELDFAWTMAGDKRLLPVRAFDDGHATFLTWPKDVSLPAILTRGPDGGFGPVNYAARGDTIVLDGVPSQIMLRSGKQMATLTSAPKASIASAAPASTVALASAGGPQP